MDVKKPIPLDSHVLRRITPMWLIDDGGGTRVSSAAFQDSGHGMSVGLTCVLDELGHDELRVLEGFEGYGLLRFAVAWIRSLELEVESTPTPTEPCTAM